jgi:hypothetical protein
MCFVVSLVSPLLLVHDMCIAGYTAYRRRSQLAPINPGTNTILDPDDGLNTLANDPCRGALFFNSLDPR